MSKKGAPEGNAIELGALLGLSARRVRYLTEMGVMSKVGRGMYNLRDSIKNYYRFEPAEGSDSGEFDSLKNAGYEDEVSSSYLSDLLGISQRRIQQLTVEGVLIKAGEGYDFAQVIPAYCEYLKGNAKSNQKDLDTENLRLVKARADKAEIAVEILLGSTVQTEAVAQIWADLVTIFRSKMLGLPNKLAATLALKDDPAEIQSLVMEEVRDALEDIARFDPEDVVERALPGDIEDDTSTSEPDSVGVGG